jgi:membrane-associated phospholipid phosphatase
MLSLLFARRRPEVFWALIVSALLTVAYSRGLKHLVDAMRPPAVLAAEQFHLIGPALRNHSFPSGHSASIAVFVGVLVIFAANWRERSALLALAAAVALSRVALGVHWPQDVLAGVYGGLMAAGLGTWLAFYWRAGLSLRVHRTLALLPLLAAGSLLSGDGGNPSVPWLIYPLVFAMLAQWWKDYGPSRA